MTASADVRMQLVPLLEAGRYSPLSRWQQPSSDNGSAAQTARRIAPLVDLVVTRRTRGEPLGSRS